MNEWADCPIAGCDAKCCLARNSKLCFPHTVNFMFFNLAISKLKD